MHFYCDGLTGLESFSQKSIRREKRGAETHTPKKKAQLRISIYAMARGMVAVLTAMLFASGVVVSASAYRASGESLVPPVVVAAWNCSGCIETAMEVLRKNGTAIDAVVSGVIVAEKDTSVHSVGWGGSPDETGESSRPWEDNVGCVSREELGWTFQQLMITFSSPNNFLR